MSAYGRNCYPRRFGGGARAYQEEHEALLLALEPGYDPAPETANYAELYAAAILVGTVWALNGRLRNQAIPGKMLEWLPDWEEALRLRPAPTARVQDRRAAVAAKFRGLSGNAQPDIYDACAAKLGSAFLELRTVEPADEVTYWPGQNPGPPGLEWSSNRMSFAVVLSPGGMSTEELIDLSETLALQLSTFIPATNTFQIGTEDGGFLAGVSLAGISLL